MSLNRNQLKYIAIAAMLVDHIAWAFVPLDTVLGQLMHFIGRFTGPVMAYFVYEGYIHTSDKRKYGLRLALFALVSWIPFCSFMNGAWCIGLPLSVIYTLFLGFLAMVHAEKHENDRMFRDDFVITALCLLSLFGDWPVFDVLWPYLLFRSRNNEKAKWRYFWIVLAASVILFFDFSEPFSSLYNLGCIVPGIVLQRCYSGEPGKKSSFNKWFFYVFYPLHLTVLAYLEILIW